MLEEQFPSMNHNATRSIPPVHMVVSSHAQLPVAAGAQMETPSTALADEYENAPAYAGAHIAQSVKRALCYNRRTVGGAISV
jgi:hypothetical protein